MTTITLKGQITEDGKLQVDLPEGIQPGEVDVMLSFDLTDDEIEALLKPNPKPGSEIAKNEAIGSWADDELNEMLNPEPMTGTEIVEGGYTGGWEHKGITDSVEFINELRRKRREKRGWQQP